MSNLTPEAEKALEYVRTLKAERERVILAGQFTRIEEYRAACTVTRELDRIHTNLNLIYEGKEAAADVADNALQPMPEETGT